MSYIENSYSYDKVKYPKSNFPFTREDLNLSRVQSLLMGRPLTRENTRLSDTNCRFVKLCNCVTKHNDGKYKAKTKKKTLNKYHLCFSFFLSLSHIFLSLSLSLSLISIQLLSSYNDKIRLYLFIRNVSCFFIHLLDFVCLLLFYNSVNKNLYTVLLKTHMREFEN